MQTNKKINNALATYEITKNDCDNKVVFVENYGVHG